jgi:hypothetical protein
MIQKTVKKLNINDKEQLNSDLNYWLSRTPEERISAVEILRRQFNGNSAGLQRTVRIIKLSEDSD